MPNPLTLSHLLDRLHHGGLQPVRVSGLKEPEIDHVSADSRRVGPTGLFVAIRGANSDGHLFIDKAVSNGAIAILCEAVPDDHQRWSGTALVQVNDTRRALALAAAALHRDPSHTVRTIGVTGTNGKTTVATLLYDVLQRLDGPAGLIGTIENRVGERVLPATHTTPDAVDLQALLSDMRTNRCRWAAAEISSHALAQHRAGGVRFAAGVFTNLSQDHLDFHRTMDEYAAAKKRLFDELPPEAVAIVNADDERGAEMVSDAVCAVVSYGRSSGDVRYRIVDNTLGGLDVELDGHTDRFRLLGDFNAANIAATYATLMALGFESTPARESLRLASPVPGRFEPVAFPDGPTVIVDYAHTPDALQNILTAVRSVAGTDRTIWCVFGCGGDRDRGKRPLMAQLAEALADRVVVTDDNPRTERSEDIMADMRPGMKAPDRADWIPDRAEAIGFALQRAGPTDVVVIAGKGHETYQVVGTEHHPFDDRATVRACLKELQGSP